MKRIPVIMIILVALTSIAMAGGRATKGGAKILDLGECATGGVPSQFASGKFLDKILRSKISNCIVAEAIHPKLGHLLQFMDNNNDGIPDDTYIFRMTQEPSSGRKGLVEGIEVRQSPKETRDIVLVICTKYSVNTNVCIQYSSLFRSWG